MCIKKLDCGPSRVLYEGTSSGFACALFWEKYNSSILWHDTSIKRFTMKRYKSEDIHSNFSNLGAWWDAHPHLFSDKIFRYTPVCYGGTFMVNRRLAVPNARQHRFEDQRDKPLYGTDMGEDVCACRVQSLLQTLNSSTRHLFSAWCACVFLKSMLLFGTWHFFFYVQDKHGCLRASPFSRFF